MDRTLDDLDFVTHSTFIKNEPTCRLSIVANAEKRGFERAKTHYLLFMS